MRLLYDLGILLMNAGLCMAAPFNPKARLWVRGRKDIFRRMAEVVGPDDEVAWLHAASLGEFEQGRPVIEALREACPRYKILLTFFSPSGYEVRKNYAGADWVFYLPADTPRNARRFLRIFRPKVAVFVKYEFWINYLLAMRKEGNAPLPDFVDFPARPDIFPALRRSVSPGFGRVQPYFRAER